MSATANGVDPALVTRIVDRVKSQGIFDQFRRDCLADVDTKPAYQNLGTRVEGYVSSFLANFVWTPEMNKNQLRNSLRRQINESEMLASGVERIIEQAVDAQIQQIFLPRIETVVKEYLHSDNASSSTSDVKTTEPPGKLGMESGPIPPQPASSGSSSSPMVLGVRGSPADSPLAGWSAATTSLQSSASYPKPPPLPGETQDQPQPPPLPDASTVQEKPKPPPLPRSREASPPPLPPSSIPERRRTSSVSSTPSLDSISSDPLSIDSEEEKPKVIQKTTPAKSVSPATSIKSTPGKATPGKVAPGKRRVILKKVVVRKADGTKVVRVVRMDPTKATAKRLLMRATSRAAGEQGGSPKGKTISPAKIKLEEDKKQPEEEESPTKSVKFPEDDLSSDVPVSPLLGKRKHLPIDTKDLKVAEEHRKTSQVKAEPVSSGDEEWMPRSERQKRKGFSREEIAAVHESSDSDEESQPFPVVPKEEDSLSKDLEDVSSSGSDMDFEEGNSSNFPPDRRDYFPVDASDSDSHVSDVTVSSVHTSDLSSFDDKISSSSSSSSSSEESEEEEEEDTDDYGRKPVKLPDQSRTDTKPISMLLASKGDAPERSVSPASSGGGKTSPRLVGEARWKRQHMVDTEDEETRAERRRRADTKVWIDQHHQARGSKAQKAEAKEERAKRRQQMKEERERQRQSATSPSQLETRKQRRGRSEDEGAESKPYTKQQLKEQKLQEKRREAKRQRSLLSQSDDGSATLDSNKPRRETQWTPPPILRQEFFLKKRRDSQIPFHHLLTLDMAYKQLLKKSQQRAKYLSMKAKEEKEGKKSYCRFAFQPPGKKSRMSRWLQASAERKKWPSGREEPSTSEAILKTVAMDEAYQLEEVPCADEEDRLEMVSPTSPDLAPPEPEKDSKGSPRLESINSPESEASYNQFGKTNTDKDYEPELERTDNMAESKRLSHEKVETVHMDENEVEIELEDGKPDDSVATDPSDMKNEENEEMRVSPPQLHIPNTDSKIVLSAESDPSSVKERNINDEEMDVGTEERVTSEEHHDEEDSKFETGKEGEQEQIDNVDKEQEVDKEEKAQISAMDKEKNAASVVEDTVPTFVVLEREEISSEEGDFDDSDRVLTEEQDSTKDEAMKLPSIFQQTEAISSDEELDDIIPSSSAKDKIDEDRVEEKSEGEVDEEAPPLAEGESITKLTEDISGDELCDTHSLENPPTPTMDEPSEFEGIREGSNDGQATIPIVLVNSPSLGGSAKDLGHSYSTGSSSDAEGNRTRESTPKDDGKCQEKKEDRKKEEIEEGELADIEEGEVPEEKEQASGRGSRYRIPSGQSDPQEEASAYGKRPRRRTFSPHQGKDDDYLYFGLPKRTRRQSPTPASSPTPPQQGAVQRKPLTRERSRSGGMSAGQNNDSPMPTKEQEERVPSALTERRSSRYSRRVSPPRRYSPSEQRTVPKGKSQGTITPPSAPSPSPSPQEPDQPSQPQQPHRHFTRRMSGRDEERRPHRYEDMYYYDNKRSRGNTNPAPASGKPARRTSAEDRKRKR